MPSVPPFVTHLSARSCRRPWFLRGSVVSVPTQVQPPRRPGVHTWQFRDERQAVRTKAPRVRQSPQASQTKPLLGRKSVLMGCSFRLRGRKRSAAL